MADASKLNKPTGKISILMPSLRGGGIEKQLLTLSDELIHREFDLDLVVINTINTAYRPKPALHLVDLGARQIRLALFPLIKYLRTTRPQVMFSVETPLNALAIISRAITGYPKRLIVGERNHLSSVATNARRLGDHLRPLLARHLYPRSDQIITVSQGVANDLINLCKIKPQKIRTIYNMFNIDEIIAGTKAEPEHPWIKTSGHPVLINVGRLSPQKDHQTLIKAFAILRARRACRLIILGEGQERSKLEQLAKQLNVADDISMPGFVSNPFVFMARAKAFVLSSAWEGLPGALIEALACGIPVISTNCPSGPAEILENGRYGILTPVGDVWALAEAISDTLDNPRPASMLRKRAMDFSVEKIIPEYMDIFQPTSF